MKKFDNHFFFVYQDQIDKNKYWRYKVLVKSQFAYTQVVSNSDKFESYSRAEFAAIGHITSIEKMKLNKSDYLT